MEALQRAQPSMPCPSSSSPDNQHFNKIQDFDIDYASTTLTQYESTRTGMRVIVVDQEGPTIHGSFALATEIHDDSGAPHTLEHLCFLGSKSFPYKGLLDKLANRAYSDTNASTATDYTEYTLDSAGWAGFVQILPVYLEHLIAPLMTDASCYTEVHHIDGKGNDAGVVYSEMQARENNSDLLMYLKSKRTLYAEGIGFRYETFGVMESLRSLTADRIRAYHKEMYQPRNLCLVLIGEVDHHCLLEVLNHFESTILQDIPGPETPFRRPWIDSEQALRLDSSSIETIEFPENDESAGEILISFFGPAYEDGLLCTASNVLLTYLAGSSASILENVLTEREQLTSSISYEIETHPIVVIHFTLSGVATEKLHAALNRFFVILTETAASPLDMHYLQDCIKRDRCHKKLYAESPAKFFNDPILEDFLFGKRDGSTLKARLADLTFFDTLLTWDDLQWRHWLRVWISEAPSVTVLGKPSASLAERIKTEEKARVEARKAQLGGATLEDLQERLIAAKAKNAEPIPEEVLKQFEVPGTDSIHFMTTTTAKAGTAKQEMTSEDPIQRLIDEDGPSSLYLHFEHIRSNFAYITLVLGTEIVPLRLKPLLTVYGETFFSNPMMRDGHRIEFEQVIKEIERDTADYEFSSGRAIGNSEVLMIKMHVEIEKYQLAVRWLQDLMKNSIFDLERIKATTARLLADIPESKRDGSDMVTCVELMLSTSQASRARATSTLVQAVYLKRIKQLLESDPQLVLNQMTEISDSLHQASNMRILVATNVRKVQHPVSSWRDYEDALGTSKPLMPLDSCLSRLSESGRSPGNIAFIIPMPPIDSSFALTVSKGPSSFTDPVFPALMVAASYLNAIEGPLWTAVRGTGLAYAANINRHINSGQVSFEIYRSPDPLKAFLASKDVVSKLIDGTEGFDEFALEGAISSIVSKFANVEATRSSAAESRFIRQVIRGLPKDWPSIILDSVRRVTVPEIREVLKTIVMPLFRGSTANLFVTCAQNLQEGLLKGFEEVGFEPFIKPLAFFQDDYGLQMPDDAYNAFRNDEDEGQVEDEDEDEDGDDVMDDTEYTDEDSSNADDIDNVDDTDTQIM